MQGTQRLWAHLFYFSVYMCGQQKPKTPKLSPHHYTGGIGGLGSIVYVFGAVYSFNCFLHFSVMHCLLSSEWIIWGMVTLHYHHIYVWICCQVLVPHPLNDPTEFGSLGDLHGISRKEGYLGGLRLLQATCKKFYQYCYEQGWVSDVASREVFLFFFEGVCNCGF